MEAEQEWLLHVGRGCLAGFGLKDETQLLPGTQLEVDREGLKISGLSVIPHPLFCQCLLVAKPSKKLEER